MAFQAFCVKMVAISAKHENEGIEGRLSHFEVLLGIKRVRQMKISENRRG